MKAPFSFLEWATQQSLDDRLELLRIHISLVHEGKVARPFPALNATSSHNIDDDCPHHGGQF